MGPPTLPPRTRRGPPPLARIHTSGRQPGPTRDAPLPPALRSAPSRPFVAALRQALRPRTCTTSWRCCTRGAGFAKPGGLRRVVACGVGPGSGPRPECAAGKRGLPPPRTGRQDGRLKRDGDAGGGQGGGGGRVRGHSRPGRPRAAARAAGVRGAGAPAGGGLMAAPFSWHFSRLGACFPMQSHAPRLDVVVDIRVLGKHLFRCSRRLDPRP